MEIKKNFCIEHVGVSHSSNTPIKITLIDSTSRQEKKDGSILTMDRKIARQRGIPYETDTTGKTLTCIIRDRPYEGYSRSKTDVLFVKSLSKKEHITPYYTTFPPTSYTRMLRILEIETPGGGDGVHFHPVPCPYFYIALELTEEEYRECKKLLPHSVFEIEFQFKS